MTLATRASSATTCLSKSSTRPCRSFLVLMFFTSPTAPRRPSTPAWIPNVVVDVRAKQWAWDYNYVQGTGKVRRHRPGSPRPANPAWKKTLPTLYLPVGKTVTLELNSRDVIHSFWVPAFLQKLDMFPGKTNYIYLTPQVEGQFDGKCAELCGEYHSEMLFNVKVVSEGRIPEPPGHHEGRPHRRGIRPQAGRGQPDSGPRLRKESNPS